MSRMTCRGGVRGESGAIVSDLHDVDIYSLATPVYITAIQGLSHLRRIMSSINPAYLLAINL